MNKIKNFHSVIRTTIFVPVLMLFLLPAFIIQSKAVSPTEPTAVCADAQCAKQKAILRQLEKTRPSKKVTEKQIFNRIKAACDRMRSLDCPEIKNYKPSICFTDF